MMDGSGIYGALGTAMCRRLSVAFYARVQKIRYYVRSFPAKHSSAIEEFAAFVAQLFGGPAEDVQRRWWLRLRESHLRFRIEPKKRDAWMNNMIQTLQDVPVEKEVRVALGDFFEQSSAMVR